MLITGPENIPDVVLIALDATSPMDCTALMVPCHTLRNSSERPDSIPTRTNWHIGTYPLNLLPFLHRLKIWNVETIINRRTMGQQDRGQDCGKLIDAFSKGQTNSN